MDSIGTTDIQINDAREAGKITLRQNFHAEAAWYEAEKDLIWIRTTNGIYYGVPAKKLQGLQSATVKQLAHIEVSPQGTGLHWPQIDADLTVQGIMTGVYGTKQWMEQLDKKEMSNSERSAVSAVN